MGFFSDLTSPTSIKLFISYALDVIAILSLGMLGYGLSFITPHYRAFSLLDLSISFPMKDQLVSLRALLVASIVAPAVIIGFVCLVFIPRFSLAKLMPFGVQLRIKIWEGFVGILGLGLSLSTEFLVIQGVKNMIGKPRPDMLSRCSPDFASFGSHVVGGFGQDISNRWVLVDQTVCTQPNKDILDDGFKSFPSGHAGAAFAGLLYLSLWLCAKFNIAFPWIPNESVAEVNTPTEEGAWSRARSREGNFVRHRSEAAAPPVYLVYLAFIPVGAATYIAASRFFDYRHHGFDILTGVLIGSLSAWFGFRWYHPPLSRGSGWAWGPRSRTRAFGAGVGSHGFVDEARWTQKLKTDDLERSTPPATSRPFQGARVGKEAHGRNFQSTYSSGDA